MRTAVLGAGVLGTAMALNLHRAGNEVVLCATELDDQTVDHLETHGTHPILQQPFPASIRLARHGSWRSALASAEAVVVGVSSSGFAPVVTAAAPLLVADAIWVIATKGWEPVTGEPLSARLEEISPGHRVVIAVGPTLAGEMSARTPTALVCASKDTQAARLIAAALCSESVKAFVTDDVAGVEVGAALKNVIAIAVGMCDGIADIRGMPMTNSKAAMFSRGLVEMSRMAVALGGRHETILGLAGAGDLFVTVLAGRNGRFGRLVGTGLDPQRAFLEMGTTVEGFENSREAMVIAERHGLNLPVVQMVYSVLHERAEPEASLAALLGGPAEDEMSSS